VLDTSERAVERVRVIPPTPPPASASDSQ